MGRDRLGLFWPMPLSKDYSSGRWVMKDTRNIIMIALGMVLLLFFIFGFTPQEELSLASLLLISLIVENAMERIF